MYNEQSQAIVTIHSENLFVMIQLSIPSVFLALKNSHLKVAAVLQSVATSLS